MKKIIITIFVVFSMISSSSVAIGQNPNPDSGGGLPSAPTKSPSTNDLNLFQPPTTFKPPSPDEFKPTGPQPQPNPATQPPPAPPSTSSSTSPSPDEFKPTGPQPQPNPATQPPPAPPSTSNSTSPSPTSGGLLLGVVRQECYEQGNCSVCDAMRVVVRIGEVLAALAAAAALLVFLYGAFLMITSAGDSSKVDDGKKAMQAAVIGLVIVFLAWPAVNLFIRFLVPKDANFQAADVNLSSAWHTGLDTICQRIDKLQTEAYGRKPKILQPSIFGGGLFTQTEPGKITNDPTIDGARAACCLVTVIGTIPTDINHKDGGKTFSSKYCKNFKPSEEKSCEFYKNEIASQYPAGVLSITNIYPRKIFYENNTCQEQFPRISYNNIDTCVAFK